MVIRKKDNELTLSDLDVYPIWEYALDEEGLAGQNEKTVRPFISSDIPDATKVFVITRTSFFLNDGTILKGHITPVSKLDLKHPPVVPVDLRPVILNGLGRVYFWYGINKPDELSIENLYSLLQKGPKDTFPIRFQSDVEVFNSISSGEINGFLYCDKETVDFLHFTSDQIKVIK